MATTCAPHRWTYNAFVSFRGEDIRKSFIDHLYKDFKHKGIHAFRDDNQLPRGEDIASQLYKAIEESRFLIVIFSKNYAFSSWCLRELVKILECKRMGEHRHEVQIIFYDVKPDVVRKQTGSYADAFAHHQFSNRSEVAKWKEALCVATNLSGWDLQDKANGYESKLIDSISKEILKKLCDGPLYVGENLVGVDARVNKMNLLRFVGSSKVHMIGICGITGIGKTTLARAIYNIMHIHFEECTFLELGGATKQYEPLDVVTQLIHDIMKTTDIKISNIGQGIMVMRQMMASRRILLVVDGIDHRNQLKALKDSRQWFSPGSLIIFTCRDKGLLANVVDEFYNMEFLDYNEALELFCLYAFREKHPTEDFKELAFEAVKYIQGHPLALEVLGCFLYGETINVWKSELDKLHKYPIADVQQVLQLSFYGLDFSQQRVFLDIASYLVGENKDFATSVLDSCDFFADTNIKVLVDRSLITISSTMSLQMHNLIQRMAREIVRKELKWVGSRLWIQSEFCDVLNRIEVTEAVEVLVLLLEKSSEKVHMDSESLGRMTKLRILQICYQELKNLENTFELNQWREPEVKFELNLWEKSKVQIWGTLEYLSNKLRLFYWHGCPLKFLPSEFYPVNIVAIDMSYSRIESLWTIPKCFTKLRSMTLRHCRNLKKTPDFTEITNLEKLILEGCVALVEVHPSIGMLKKLVVLNMRNCESLMSFPFKVEMDSLEVLIISGCSKVEKWPKVSGTIKTLSSGWISTFVPSSILCKLQHPQSFVLPSFVSSRFLRELNVSYCNISELSPETFEGLSGLQRLNLSGNNFTSLPASLSQLSQLATFRVVDCKKLEVLPELPPSVAHCFASGCTSLHILPQLSITHHRKMHISLLHCQNFVDEDTIKSLVSMLLPPQVSKYLGEGFDLFFHGNTIPPWFTFQSRVGKPIYLSYSKDVCYNKIRGYEVCLVFKPNKNFDARVLYHCLSCSIRYKTRDYDYDSIGETVQERYGYLMTDEFAIESTRIDGLHLTWLFFSKCNMLPESFRFSAIRYFDLKECGVRLIWDEDVQTEMDLSTTQEYS